MEKKPNKKKKNEILKGKILLKFSQIINANKYFVIYNEFSQ